MKPNRRQKMNGLTLLHGIDAGSASYVALDPQYRSNMDYLGYGNEGARQVERAKLRQQSEEEIAAFVAGSERSLAPSGHLALWVNKFMIGTGVHNRLMTAAPTLQIVDLICWNTLGFGMGQRSRGVAEYLVVAQKKPIRAKGVWIDHAIRDCWPERAPDTHPHAKPIELMTRLICATTRPGDLVIDPCAGGYGVLDVCKASGRTFIGCDVAG